MKKDRRSEVRCPASRSNTFFENPWDAVIMDGPRFHTHHPPVTDFEKSIAPSWAWRMMHKT